jgi:hypothetical protein
MVLAFPRPDTAWVEVGPTSIGDACCWRRQSLPKSDSPVFPKILDCAPARLSSNCAGEPRRVSLIILSKLLLCSRFDQKVHQHILATLLGNRSSPAMAHYGMEIYNNNTIMPSIYINPEVGYANYLPTHQAYNINAVDRSHVAMPVSSSHINMHNSYSSTDMSRWSNHNAYVFEHASNMHNGFAPLYSLTELASHYTPQSHMSMGNCYSQANMRASANFGQSLYTTQDSIRMEIAPSPPIVSSAFHLASPIYSRVEESLANTPASSTNRSDVDKGFDTKMTIEDLPIEYRWKLEVINLKMEEAFMARYDVTNHGLVL